MKTPPVDLDDAAKADILRHQRVRIKRLIWPVFGAAFVVAVAVGVGSAYLHVSPAAYVTGVLALAAAAGLLGLLLGRRAERASAALRTPRVLGLLREDMDKGYRRFLRNGPFALAALGLLSGLQIEAWQAAGGADPMRVLTFILSILAFLMVCCTYLSLLAGRGRQGLEDEMVVSHRGQAYGAGFFASAISGLAFAAFMVTSPRIGAMASPLLFALPLMVAMVRFGLLERAAASDA